MKTQLLFYPFFLNLLPQYYFHAIEISPLYRLSLLQFFTLKHNTDLWLSKPINCIFCSFHTINSMFLYFLKFSTVTFMSDTSALIVFNVMQNFYTCIVYRNMVNEPHMSLCFSLFSEIIYLQDPKCITDTVSTVFIFLVLMSLLYLQLIGHFSVHPHIPFKIQYLLSKINCLPSK